MKTSTLLMLAIGAAVVWFVFKKQGVLAPSPQSQTSAQNSGSQSAVPKDTFQQTTDAIDNLFKSSLALVGGATAQTAPKSL